ncbi:MAG TPA: hypothetical protein VLB44_06570, partial [Kofleriaceae bacterium]|nr:hypothetical protein [Kofleriaceae bacterium]
SRDDRRSAPVARDVAVRPDLSGATQADLAHELDLADRRGTWREVEQRWEGQRLHWTVTRQRVLCQSASACNVAPFPIQRPAQQGWLPALELTPIEMAKIEAGCGSAQQCELEFEGTLTDLAVSGEMPTSMRFGSVRIVRARASRA